MYKRQAHMHVGSHVNTVLVEMEDTLLGISFLSTMWILKVKVSCVAPLFTEPSPRPLFFCF